jgi:hypothetical protein
LLRVEPHRLALAIVAGVIAIIVALLAGFGLEARGVRFAGAKDTQAAGRTI